MVQEAAFALHTRQVAAPLGVQPCQCLCKQASLAEPAVPPAPTGSSSATQQVRVLTALQRLIALSMCLRCALGLLHARL